MGEQVINTIWIIVACIGGAVLVVVGLGIVAVKIMARLGMFDIFKEV